jgi:hypothetical protein
VEQLIQECAARILKLLQRRGIADILSLPEYLDERSVIAYQALGWLAREGRIDYAERGSQVMVKARPRKDPEGERPTERREP